MTLETMKSSKSECSCASCVFDKPTFLCGHFYPWQNQIAGETDYSISISILTLFHPVRSSVELHVELLLIFSSHFSSQTKGARSPSLNWRVCLITYIIHI